MDKTRKVIRRLSYNLVPVTKDEYEAANIKALENNTSGLAFSCPIQDSESLDAIQEMLNDNEITSASFETWQGDYAPLFVRYLYPSFRYDDNAWYKVVFKPTKGK